MKKRKKYNRIPTELSEEDFNAFIFPHLSIGERGPLKKLSYYKLFHYIMKILYTGMQWKSLPIDCDINGVPEIHYTSIFKIFKRWATDGSFESVFCETVVKLFKENLVDVSIIHGDGTNHAAKKGGDNLGYNQHKKLKGDKVVAACDRNVNVIAPFVTAEGNRNECILLPPCLVKIKEMANKVSINLPGSIISLDSIYNSQSNRKYIFNRGMTPNIKPRKCDLKRKGRKQMYNPEIFKERFNTIERLFAWEDKFKRVLQRFEFISEHFYGFKLLVYSMINLRHFVA